MRCACCKTKATDSHSEYVVLLVLHSKSDYVNAPQYIYTYIAWPVYSSFYVSI